MGEWEWERGVVKWNRQWQSAQRAENKIKVCRGAEVVRERFPTNGWQLFSSPLHSCSLWASQAGQDGCDPGCGRGGHRAGCLRWGHKQTVKLLKTGPCLHPPSSSPLPPPPRGCREAAAEGYWQDAGGGWVRRGVMELTILRQWCVEKGHRREIIKGGSNHFCVTAWLYLALQTNMLPLTGGVFMEWQRLLICVCVCVSQFLWPQPLVTHWTTPACLFSHLVTGWGEIPVNT